MGQERLRRPCFRGRLHHNYTTLYRGFPIAPRTGFCNREMTDGSIAFVLELEQVMHDVDHRYGLTRVTLRYTVFRVIKSWRHKGLQRFFEAGSKAGIQPHQAERVRRQLLQLDEARCPEHMNTPGWRLHQLSTDHWSVTVNPKFPPIFTSIAPIS